MKESTMRREEHYPPCPKIECGQEELTAEQRAYARQFAEARIAAMLSCAPIDETEAEEWLRQAHHVARLPPARIRWFDSPMPFISVSFPGWSAEPRLVLRQAERVVSSKHPSGEPHSPPSQEPFETTGD
jgi:hypothetical protein